MWGYCPDVDGVRGEGGEGGDGGEPQCSVMWSVAWCPLLQGEYTEADIMYRYVLYVSVYCTFLLVTTS